MTRPDTPTSSPGGVALEGTEAASSVAHEERLACLRTMKAFSELLENEEVPAFIRERVVFQVGSN